MISIFRILRFNFVSAYINNNHMEYETGPEKQ